jgi:hypothetical protein
MLQSRTGLVLIGIFGKYVCDPLLCNYILNLFEDVAKEEFMHEFLFAQ